MDVVVGIGEMEIRKHSEVEGLKAIALGSCVAVCVWCEIAKIVAMAHIVYPQAKEDEVAGKGPAHFADLGIDNFFQKIKENRCNPKNDYTRVALVGGASMSDGESSSFKIGKRNVLAVRKRLWKHGVTPIIEDVGGTGFRTVILKAQNGELRVGSNERGEYIL